jgi:quercetin dioxygenase-like cupin family protein
MTVSRHLICRADSARYAPAGASPGAPAGAPSAATAFARWNAVGEHTGAVQTGFGICELQPGGGVPAHVHSFEESFHVLAGTPVLRTPEGTFRLEAGDYGLIPPGMPHTWRNPGEPAARWADMQAPQPRARNDDDTYTLPGEEQPRLASGEARPVDVRDPRTRSFGHIEAANMDPARQSQDLLAVSASMRTALLVYSGITVKMMVDGDLGAQLSTMFMVQYEPEGVAGPHDHPFEETYLILEGATDASFDGERYRLGPGDIAWAGVGCVHSFANAGGGPVRWLETQAPQPPPRHSYRFARDWDYLRGALAGRDSTQGSA